MFLTLSNFSLMHACHPTRADGLRRRKDVTPTLRFNADALVAAA
ncbi:Uncharacterized protein ToN1_46980 [Aromatoleum petrolei]|nr:Uncharacterized protein ToN1_46980 [Aromatoleum petrolei]